MILLHSQVWEPLFYNDESEWTTALCNDIDESHKYNFEYKKAYTVYTIWFYSYKSKNKAKLNNNV